MKILIYGGTFNPPHLGHIRAVTAVAQALKPDMVFLLPAATPPHKDMPENSASTAHRRAMTELAAQEIPGAQVLDIELHRTGKSYTSDTLRQLKRQYPMDELIFLVGTDMYLSLDTWHEPETVFSLASIALFARETGRWSEIRAKTEMYQLRFGTTMYIIPGTPVEVSSTELREGLSRRQGAELLPDGVYRYILHHRLYGVRPNLLWLRTQAYQYLKEKRIPHVQGTEQEAVRLAEHWGQSVDDAAEAAICHDITKKLERDDQLRLCDKYGIMIDEMERASEKLLHAKTGAAFAQDLFGLSDTVTQAIRWHTTGRAGMNELEKIIYLADYIEPHRAGFDGLAELRQAAYEDLDRAMELGMRMTLQDVRARGYAAHGDTLTGHAWFMQRLAEKGLAPVHAPGVDDTV